MAQIDVRVVPLGTPTPGVAKYVHEALRIAGESGLSYVVTPTSTCLEGPLEDIVQVALRMHEACFTDGVQRVVTTLTIDDRRDQSETLDDKVRRVADPNETSTPE